MINTTVIKAGIHQITPATHTSGIRYALLVAIHCSIFFNSCVYLMTKNLL